MTAVISSKQLSGTFDLLTVPEVLQLISSSGKTGVLRFAVPNPDLQCKIAFRDGRVVGVSGRCVPKLADVLLKLGVAPHVVGSLGAELSQHKSTQVLATLGREKLLEALRWRLESALLMLWSCAEGGFEFENGDSPALLELGLSVEAVMLEVARRTDEVQKWVLPAIQPEAIFNIAERVGDFSSVLRSLMPADWALLNALDGNSSLAMVASNALQLWDEFVPRVVHLEQSGLIEPKIAQRGVHRRYARLKRGDFAPAFTLPALDGSSVSLGSLRGQRTLLAFFRHAGCPFCNLRVHQLIEAYPRLERLGIRVVGVFGSSVQGLRERVGKQKPPFPLVADPDDAIHALYGTSHSLLGLLDFRAFPAYLEGIKLGIPHGSTDGEATRMPADFLIGTDLRIEAALYGANAAEHLPIKALEQWGATGQLPV